MGRRGVEKLAVALVREDAGGLGQRNERRVVDLVCRGELSCDRRHRPVANGLRATAGVPVARRGELAAELAAQSGLLLDLAHCRLLLGLARLELPLGERPVVVRRAVDEQDLGGAVLAGSADEPACGTDRAGHIQARSSGAATFSQATRQFAR